jgi:hypothetical protein
MSEAVFLLSQRDELDEGEKSSLSQLHMPLWFLLLWSTCEAILPNSFFKQFSFTNKGLSVYRFVRSGLVNGVQYIIF